MTIRKMLEKNNIKVVGETTNGKDAIEKYKILNPKVVTMDITMPKLDGVDSIKEIIKIDPKAKIIVCSSRGQESLVMKAIACGAKSFIVKPINEKRLIEEVNKLL
jgi:two-component system chemotaxis response regulator CheY